MVFNEGMTTNVIDLNTTAGIATYIKSFTDKDLLALADAPVTMANFLFGAAAEMEAIIRGLR